MALLFTGESAAHGLLAAAGIRTGNTDLGSVAFTIIIIDALMCLAIYAYSLAPAPAGTRSSHAVSFPLLETSAASLIRFAGVTACYLDISPGT